MQTRSNSNTATKGENNSKKLNFHMTLRSSKKRVFMDIESAALENAQKVKPETQQIRYKPIRRPLFSIDIDFDGASLAWRQNKISVGNGCYEYRET